MYIFPSIPNKLSIEGNISDSLFASVNVTWNEVVQVVSLLPCVMGQDHEEEVVLTARVGEDRGPLDCSVRLHRILIDVHPSTDRKLIIGPRNIFRKSWVN